MSTCGLCGAGRRPLAAAAAAVLTIALPRPDQHPETVWSDPCTISGPVHATEGASEHYLGRLHWSQLPMTLSSAIVDHGQEGAQGAVHLSSYQDTRQGREGRIRDPPVTMHISGLGCGQFRSMCGSISAV